MKNKMKKEIKFWKKHSDSVSNPILKKGFTEEAKREERRYIKHRNKGGCSC